MNKENSQSKESKEEIFHSPSLNKIQIKCLPKITLSSLSKLPSLKYKSWKNIFNKTIENNNSNNNSNYINNIINIEQSIQDNSPNSLTKCDLSNSKFHNRNLDYIKKISSKINSLRKINLTKIQKSPMERYNIIKKKFILYVNEKNNSNEVNKSITENLIPKIEEKKEDKIFYYRIEKGNNSELIKKCFEYRLNWSDYRKTDSSITENDLNFMWTPTSNLINYNLLSSDEIENKNITMANHFENHNQISNKLKMFFNLIEYTENKNIDIFSFIPLTIIIEYESDKFLKQFSNFSHIFNHINDFLNDSSNYKNIKNKYSDYFYVNNNYECKIGTKTIIYIQNNHYDGKNLWLLKALNLNRGRCIKLIDSVESCEIFIKNFYNGILKSFRDSENNKEQELKDNTNKIIYILPKIKIKKKEINPVLYHQIDYYSLLKKINTNKKYQSSKLILQKYIEKPLLYKKRKFDMRIWVLLTHKMETYIFKEGHLKATSYVYDSQSKNPYVHLTNYSIQKYCENFSKFEKGNEISFSEFEESLKNDYNININVQKDIYPKLYEIIKMTIDSVKDKINTNKKNCYEIFGYDFMFDKDINPYLIEINTNPGLEISSPLISILVPRMIDDAFRLTIDDYFGIKYKDDRFDNGKFISPFHVDGYDDSEIMYFKIGDLEEKYYKRKK